MSLTFLEGRVVNKTMDAGISIILFLIGLVGYFYTERVYNN